MLLLLCETSTKNPAIKLEVRKKLNTQRLNRSLQVILSERKIQLLVNKKASVKNAEHPHFALMCWGKVVHNAIGTDNAITVVLPWLPVCNTEARPDNLLRHLIVSLNKGLAKVLGSAKFPYLL